jgi:hypothetical protein
MARIFPRLTSTLQDFIAQQQMFFVATAGVDGRVNLSPKGADTFRVLSPERVVWLNLTGSGNETAAHLRELNRITIMFCAFTGTPLILRLYGSARTVHAGEPGWSELLAHFPSLPGARQIFEIQLDSVQTSCGFAVPEYEFIQQRTRLHESMAQRGEAGVKAYWQEKNRISIDGKPTGMPEP